MNRRYFCAAVLGAAAASRLADLKDRFKPIDVTLQEKDYIDEVALNTKQIARIFRVPEELLKRG